jgi:hypothetical protein
MSQRFRFIGATLLVGAVITGCISLIPYAPKETLVKDLGMEKARVQLKETVLRARQTIQGIIGWDSVGRPNGSYILEQYQGSTIKVVAPANDPNKSADPVYPTPNW